MGLHTHTHPHTHTPFYQCNMSEYFTAEWRNVLIGGANGGIKEEAL